MPPWLSTLLGALLIAVALRDIFHTLFRPTGWGSVSHPLLHGVWRAVRRVARQRPPLLALAGPLGLVAVTLVWVALVALGWALVYLPWLPGGFQLAPGLEPSEAAGFLDALYLSFVTLATLGFGDIVPTTGWLRLITPLESLVGFALLTAAVTWVLSIYPALARQRTVATLAHAVYDAAQGSEPAEPLDPVLTELASGIASVNVDFAQHPAIYYFQAPHERASLARVLPYLRATGARADAAGGTRGGRAVLASVVDDLADTLARNFLARPDAPTRDVLALYADEQGVEPLRRRESPETSPGSSVESMASAMSEPSR